MLLLPVIFPLALLGHGAAALTASPDLTDVAALDEFQRQWMAKVQRVPSEALMRCPVSCSSVGAETGAWDLYPNAARMAVCNETVLFTMMLDTDLAPTALRVW